jgi:HK97 family phage portal protein
MSALAYMARSLGIAIEADARVASLAETGGKATGVLTVDKALTESQRVRIKENFKDMESGSESGLFVLEAGFEYQQISISPADMQLIENRRFQIEDVARFIGVPSVLINDTSATTVWGSGIGQITQGFYKLNLRPYLERIESSAKRWMMPPGDWEKVELRFNFDALLRADKQERIESNSVAVNSMQMTPNEARAEEGKPPVSGGDQLFGNSTLIPIAEAAKGGEGAENEEA